MEKYLREIEIKYIDHESYATLQEQLGFQDQIAFDKKYPCEFRIYEALSEGQSLNRLTNELEDYLSVPMIQFENKEEEEFWKDFHIDLLERLDTVLSMTQQFEENFVINEFRSIVAGIYWHYRSKDPMEPTQIDIKIEEVSLVENDVTGDPVLVWSQMNESVMTPPRDQAEVPLAPQGIMLYYLSKHGFFRKLSYSQRKELWYALTGYSSLNNTSVEVSSKNIKEGAIFKKSKIKEVHFDAIVDFCQEVINDINSHFKKQKTSL